MQRLILCVLLQGLPLTCIAAELDLVNSSKKILANENLVAWCIVPFDAKKRNSVERAQMVRRLGLKKIAYDWRDEHVPTFEDEILQYKKHGIEFFAFWDWHPSMEELVIKHKIKPQIWRISQSPTAPDEEQRVALAATAQLPLVRKAKKLGLKLGLYNHGGWGGDPKNMVKVCRYLREQFQADHVGIVYNFHHGHDDIDSFPKSLEIMMPYLLCVNLNGMARPEAMRKDPANNKILSIGDGDLERKMIESLCESGWSGPVGIIDHRPKLDAEKSLRSNLIGLEEIRRQLSHRYDTAPEDRPTSDSSVNHESM